MKTQIFKNRSALFALLLAATIPNQNAHSGEYQLGPDPLNDPREIRDMLRGIPHIHAAVKVLQQAPVCGETPKKEFIPQQLGPHVDADGVCEEIVKADDSSNFKYFSDLLKRGKSAPINDFLKLWYPEQKESKVEPYIFHCQKAPWMQFKGAFDAHLSDDCKPDTLYSWGPAVKLEAIKKDMPAGSIWTGELNTRGGTVGGGIYTSISPASTFGYGPIPIRFKIRPDVPFRIMSGASDREIGVRNYDRYQDFVIGFGSHVASWSYGTPELYDEIVRDILNFKSGRRGAGYLAEVPKGTGLDRLYSEAADGYDENDDELKDRLLTLIRMILNGEGRIYSQKGYCGTRAKHYSTNKPTYINPRTL